jgi:hypothetical protein
MSETFSIKLSGQVINGDGEEIALGAIRIDDFEEAISCPLSYWKQDEYLQQWCEGLKRLVENDVPSAVVTSMYDPKFANFIMWWIMYPIGDVVYIQNQILFMEDIVDDFSLENIYKFIPARETINEDGMPISEWTISRRAVSSFLKNEA